MRIDIGCPYTVEIDPSIESWDYSTSIPEVMQALNALVLQNKVLYLGVSDTPGMRPPPPYCR